MKHQVLMLFDISNLRNLVNIVEYDETADVCLSATKIDNTVHEVCVDSFMGN